MDELLSDEQRQLRESAGKLCADHGGARRARALRDSGQDIDRSAWRAIVEAGWLGMMVPEARGGLGLGAVEFYIVLAQARRHVVMTPLLDSLGASWLFGALERPSETLAEISNGKRLVAPALEADGWSFP